MSVTYADMRALQAGVEALTILANRDLQALLKTVSTPGEATQVLHDLLPALIDTYGEAAATYAADWYDDQRADLEIPTQRFYAEPAAIPDTGTHSLIQWSLKTATTDETFLGLLAGGTQKRVANFARKTIMESTERDTQAEGWQRFTRPDGCHFCRMVAGRGAVYTESTVDFGPHDDCHCQAVCVFKGTEKPVKPFTPSARKEGWSEERQAAENQRAREWMTGHLT